MTILEVKNIKKLYSSLLGENVVQALKMFLLK